jgi:hypothetical protein
MTGREKNGVIAGSSNGGLYGAGSNASTGPGISVACVWRLLVSALTVVFSTSCQRADRTPAASTDSDRTQIVATIEDYRPGEALGYSADGQMVFRDVCTLRVVSPADLAGLEVVVQCKSEEFAHPVLMRVGARVSFSIYPDLVSEDQRKPVAVEALRDLVLADDQAATKPAARAKNETVAAVANKPALRKRLARSWMQV